MEYYIETGLSGRKRYKLHEITPYNLPNLKNHTFNEFNIIHDCLVSLEKINKNIIRKNNII